MKTKHAFLILLIGFILNTTGGYLKISHYDTGILSAKILLSLGLIFELTGALFFLYKLFTYPRFRDFMNW